MSLETDLLARLTLACPRVYPDVAPAGTARPFVVYQGIGGRAFRYYDNTTNKRHSLMQVSVWASTRLECLNLARQIEGLIVGATAFQASPDAEALSVTDSIPDGIVYGSHQDFSIWSDR